MSKYKPLPIQYFDHYAISDCGEVVNTRSGKILAQNTDRDGYKVVSLYSGTKRLYRSVHKLVALTYLENLEGYAEINHIDNDPTNNHVSNLEWCSRLHNERHKWKTNYDVAYRGAMKGINKMNGGVNNGI